MWVVRDDMLWCAYFEIVKRVDSLLLTWDTDDDIDCARLNMWVIFLTNIRTIDKENKVASLYYYFNMICILVHWHDSC